MAGRHVALAASSGISLACWTGLIVEAVAHVGAGWLVGAVIGLSLVAFALGLACVFCDEGER